MIWLTVGALLGGCVASTTAVIPPTISAARMQATVAYLASKEMRGRRVGSPQNARTADWLAARFAEIGLAPAVDGSFAHEFAYGERKGRNIAGIIEAAGVGGGGKSSEYVVVGAHFDGVGDVGAVHRPAADDNASGVAALLEMARAVVAERKSLRRNVVFVAFDAEEVGLVGSTRFVLDEIVPSEDTRFAVVFDMIGGRFFPWQDPVVIALGTEHSTYVRSTVERLRTDRATPIELLGTYVLEPAGPLMARSDYRAYRRAEIPYVFFSTGTPWYYHAPEDTIDRVDIQQSADVTRFALDLVMEVAGNACEVDFKKRASPEVLDLAQLQRILGEILEHRSEIRLADVKFAQMEKMQGALARCIEQRKPSRVLAQRALMLIFEAAQRSRPL
jgi:Peptidase family M28